MKENPMRGIRIEKVTLNIGCGDDKQKIEGATKLLEMITEGKPVVTVSKSRSTFGVAKGRPLGVKVTLRKNRASEMFDAVLKSADNNVKSSQIDNSGNINFGVKEYIDLPNVRYSPEIGMMGMDAAVTLERPGFKVKKRKVRKSIIGKRHKIYKEDTINWLRQRGVSVE